MSTNEVLNVIVALLAVGTLVLASLLYWWVRAPALLVLMLAFVWGAGIRVSILTQWDFVVDHSAQLQVGTWLLWFLGLGGLLMALRHFNGMDAYSNRELSNEFDRRVEEDRAEAEQ